MLILWWLLQFKLIVPSVVLLAGLMWGIRRYQKLWLWLFIWVPYYILGNAIHEILRHAAWNSKAMLSTSDSPGLLIQYAPLFLAVPVLVCLNIWLFKRAARAQNGPG
jgi:hypothetical protein